MAPLQRRALLGLIFGVVWAIAIVLVFLLMGGVEIFDKDEGFRLIIDGLWIGGLVAYLLLFETIIRRRGKFDERDKLVIERAVRIQWIAIIVSQVLWVIGLSEGYRAQGQVPVVYLYLMFISTLIVSSVAQSAGILIGYGKMEKGG
jgi:hypothetical protein